MEKWGRVEEGIVRRGVVARQHYAARAVFWGQVVLAAAVRMVVLWCRTGAIIFLVASGVGTVFIRRGMGAILFAAFVAAWVGVIAGQQNAQAGAQRGHFFGCCSQMMRVIALCLMAPI